MAGFRAGLVLMWLVLFGYTLAVIAGHGPWLLPVFFGDIAALGWPGQFNLDFLCLLLLSGLWVAWRHRFSPAGLGLGLAAAVGGALFLCIYLLVASLRVRGDVTALLVGEAEAGRRS